jgi:hypothetical protein
MRSRFSPIAAVVRLVGLGTLAVAGTLAFSCAPAMAAVPSTAPIAYTCTGGDFASGNLVSIPSGNYASLTVTGACDVAPDAVISVVGNVNVAAGGALDAQSAPSTMTIGGNVTAVSGSLLGLGCQPTTYYTPPNTAHPCMIESNGHSTITVNGNVTAIGANTVLLNGITVKGNVTLSGGGGAIPWSIKNNAIGGNLTVVGVTADWLGVLFNGISGNVTLSSVTATDPSDPRGPGEGPIFVVRNTIGANLTCLGLAPGVVGGAFPGEVNVVGGNAIGQCANLTDLAGE